jgi:hypothetical protein
MHFLLQRQMEAVMACCLIKHGKSIFCYFLLIRKAIGLMTSKVYFAGILQLFRNYAIPPTELKQKKI